MNSRNRNPVESADADLNTSPGAPLVWIEDGGVFFDTGMRWPFQVPIRLLATPSEAADWFACLKGLRWFTEQHKRQALALLNRRRLSSSARGGSGSTAKSDQTPSLGKSLVWVENQWLVFDDGTASHYDVKLDQFADHSSARKWFWHLQEKHWFSREHKRQALALLNGRGSSL